jgi:hypothetical protein
MPNILHRLSIDAPPERVHQPAASTDGIEQWWTGRPVAGDDAIGGQLSVYFRDPANPSAIFEVLARSSDKSSGGASVGPLTGSTPVSFMP